jgi:hypothetical protein
VAAIGLRGSSDAANRGLRQFALGAIAALDASDGSLRWLTTYPRTLPSQKVIDPPLNPAIYDRGIVFTAPADFDGILALDAYTGQLLWDNKETPDDMQLIGVSGGKLWACGKSLCALDARNGKVEYHSVEDASIGPAVTGHGRGLLAGSNVYWPVQVSTSNEKPRPTEFQIRAFDSHTTKEILPPMRLSTLNPSCESGNLLATSQSFVIASPNRLMMFKQQEKAAPKHSMD